KLPPPPTRALPTSAATMANAARARVGVVMRERDMVAPSPNGPEEEPRSLYGVLAPYCQPDGSASPAPTTSGLEAVRSRAAGTKTSHACASSYATSELPQP